jgi:hypothetical protein
MKPKLLYIGNKLSKHGFNATTIETLGKSFEDEGYSVVYSSNKKNGDTIFNDKGKVIADKSVEITGILINGFAVHIDMIDKLFHCVRDGSDTITHENYWGFNGCIKINFTGASPMRYMLELSNQFDVNRLEWQDGKK